MLLSVRNIVDLNAARKVLRGQTLLVLSALVLSAL